MNSLRVDTNKNNTIIEISGDNFIDLLSHEIQVESDYDFPTGQPIIYYRWNGDEISGYVEVNSEEIIKGYSAEAGTLTGLDLEPHIENVIGGDFTPNSTKDIVIEGVNFSPFSQVEINGEGNFVNTIYFDSPKRIRASITVSGVEGIFNLTVKNNDLHSNDSGFNLITIKTKYSVDLRTTPIVDLGIEKTLGIGVTQDVNRGLHFTGIGSSWNRGVKFSTYFWNRGDDITFEMIFTTTTNVNFMIGIASSTLNVGYINSAYYSQEIGMYHNNNKFTTMYGGGDVNNWSQSIGTTITFKNNVFYKLKLNNSGANNALCSIWEVDGDDWDSETELYSWISNCPADDVILVPFVLPQSASGGYYITGFRY